MARFVSRGIHIVQVSILTLVVIVTFLNFHVETQFQRLKAAGGAGSNRCDLRCDGGIESDSN